MVSSAGACQGQTRESKVLWAAAQKQQEQVGSAGGGEGAAVTLDRPLTVLPPHPAMLLSQACAARHDLPCWVTHLHALRCRHLP